MLENVNNGFINETRVQQSPLELQQPLPRIYKLLTTTLATTTTTTTTTIESTTTTTKQIKSEHKVKLLSKLVKFCATDDNTADKKNHCY